MEEIRFAQGGSDFNIGWRTDIAGWPVKFFLTTEERRTRRSEKKYVLRVSVVNPAFPSSTGSRFDKHRALP
jgi:hypothetical protein